MTNSKWEILLDGLAKRALFWSPLRSYVLHKYRYGFSPAQLARLTELATAAAEVPGDFVEIGCYRGYTTVWLNRHMDSVAPEKRYHAVDTFTGFCPEDVQHEQRWRGKDSEEDRRAFAKFTINSSRWFEAALRENGITRVRVHDVPVQHWAPPPEIRFCFALIDVDLYLPTRAALAKIWPQLSPAGVIVIDDCAAAHVFDGARQAVAEFARAEGVSFELLEGKLGVLRKPTNGLPPDTSTLRGSCGDAGRNAVSGVA